MRQIVAERNPYMISLNYKAHIENLLVKEMF